VFSLAANTAKDKYYWHQDQPYWACQGKQVCSVWLALTDCTADSGALEFVLGTDRGAIYAPVAFGAEEVSPPADGDYVDGPIPDYHNDRKTHAIVS
jgi:ectoine hydroxylase-related dioxygenase (phytanoyl-CoA dioxygenase family)